MTPSLEAVTTRTLGLAMDAAVLRQQALAANIANANAEGFAPLTVNFEAQLEAARMSLQSRGTVDPGALEGVAPRIEVRQGPGSSKVMLDAEIASLAQNAVQFQALVRGLSRHFGIMALAAGDGRK